MIQTSTLKLGTCHATVDRDNASPTPLEPVDVFLSTKSLSPAQLEQEGQRLDKEIAAAEARLGAAQSSVANLRKMVSLLNSLRTV